MRRGRGQAHRAGTLSSSPGRDPERCIGGRYVAKGRCCAQVSTAGGEPRIEVRAARPEGARKPGVVRQMAEVTMMKGMVENAAMSGRGSWGAECGKTGVCMAQRACRNANHARGSVNEYERIQTVCRQAGRQRAAGSGR